MEHVSWKNPWNKKDEYDSFLDRFEKGLEDYPHMVAALTHGGGDLKKAVNDLNESGTQERA